MPLHGFTRMFENMLDHPNITIVLNTDYRDVLQIRALSANWSIPVRSTSSSITVSGNCPTGRSSSGTKPLNVEQLQPVAVINYPNEHDYTRVTEFKHLTGQAHAKTSMVYEYPCDGGDPYYPVPRPENAALYKQYEALAAQTPGVHFVGPAGDVQVLQHGSGGGSGADAVRKLSGSDARGRAGPASHA